MLNNEPNKNFEWIYLYGQEKRNKFDAAKCSQIRG